MSGTTRPVAIIARIISPTCSPLPFRVTRLLLLSHPLFSQMSRVSPPFFFPPPLFSSFLPHRPLLPSLQCRLSFYGNISSSSSAVVVRHLSFLPEMSVSLTPALPHLRSQASESLPSPSSSYKATLWTNMTPPSRVRIYRPQCVVPLSSLARG